MPQVVEIPGLSKADADERAANFRIDTDQVDIIQDAGGTFTVRATYPDGMVVPGAVQVPPAAPPAGGKSAPDAGAAAPPAGGKSAPDAGAAAPPAGGKSAPVAAAPPQSPASGPTITDDNAGGFEFKGLSQVAANAEAAFFRDSGVSVDIVAEGNGLFTVRVGAQVAQPPGPAAPPAAPNAPNLDGYVFCLDRIRTERRPGMAFDRTVSRYQAYFNRAPVADIFGMAVERQGPGDNGPTGKSQHRCIAAGTYPLFTHAGANNKYRTIGYLSPPNYPNRPWPALGVENTGSREGILIHCAAGYLMSIGCINLTSNIVNAQTNVVFNDSWNRVTALIDSIKSHLGAAFPASNNVPLANTHLVIRE